jgi:hypothetical protein
MELASFLKNLLNESNLNQKVFKALAIFVAIIGIFIGLNILFPAVVTTIFNILWVVLMAIVVIFIGLGLLVILGMKKDVNRILDVLLERSLTIFDFIDFLKEVWKRFKTLLKEFLIYSAPILAGVLALIIYILLIVCYKTVGATYDVTFLTVGITMLLMFFVELLNRGRTEENILSWGYLFAQKFKNTFADAFEVVLFIFFFKYSCLSCNKF